jgi:hypothetical protein
MGLERRGRADQGQPGANPAGEEPRVGPGPKVKPFEIGKRLMYEAWEKVRANKGAPGVDAVSIGVFEQQWQDNLYKLWNRMSSGSYFPGPVRGVEIPKDHGAGVRLLGVLAGCHGARGQGGVQEADHVGLPLLGRGGQALGVPGVRHHPHAHGGR